ncbi:NF-X1-type zinc finger protein NFXL1 [Bacillus rossius redtenbacheri]|uniref:NF-X1-type zinc finger protein NFXL1 n=1 Tax=Bacillus rossius redtenbacheri TaxID=93214 RepID=UPI002FDE94B4
MAWQRGRGRARPLDAVAKVVAEAEGNKPSRAAQKGRGRAGTAETEGGEPSRATSAQRRFQEARAQQQAAIQKHVKTDYESSEEEEDLESEDVLGSVLQSYAQLGGRSDDLGRTQKFLEEMFVSGAATCLVCIASVRRADAIWSCEGCYSFFHLTCVQRWAKDSVAHQRRALEGLLRGHTAPAFRWACPKCRREYEETSAPQRYVCFCGQSQDPPHHPWLLPHSCGETCGRLLQPECGHRCLLLCHPGPCPPCPKMVSVRCHCGRSGPRMQRCSRKAWACGGKCGRTLGCGRHRCDQACHPGECSPCDLTSLQACHCGARSEQRLCASPRWSCDKVCGERLGCERHSCERVCHAGECGACPLSGPRTCPCGKTVHRLPCTETVPLCGDTCGRTLLCGRHACSRPCHRDACGLCLEVVTRPCRCGLHSKELPCQKEFLCDSKCKQLKDCGRHPCNRKCCDGNCPPCEKECGRTLRCGNHKCAGVCHRGPCYPCPRTVQVSCRCGKTSVAVPCGRERRTRPPRCPLPCKQPPDCHHARREKHRCHPGDCPPCRQVCGRVRAACPHLCPAPCHSAVLVRVEAARRPAGPWEAVSPQLEVRDLPCPPCAVPVPVTCPGGHETSDQPCSSARPHPCGRVCGRALPCGNHNCSKPCHTVSGDTDSSLAGPECEACEQGCAKPRPEGCAHACPEACHPGPCPPCAQMVRLGCHCGLAQPWVRCGEWTGAAPEQRRALQSCRNQCPRKYPCGHRCREECHPGDCPSAELCRRKVKVLCACQRLRREFSCDVARAGLAVVPCDDACHARQREQLQAREAEELRRKEQEARRDQEELERFQRKFQPQRKRRDRGPVEETRGRRLPSPYWLLPLAALAVAVYLAWAL